MAKKKDLMVMGSRPINDACRNENLERIDQSIDALQSTINGLVNNIKPENMACENVGDLYKLSIALSSLARARVESEKYKLEASGMFDRACQLLAQEIRHLIGTDPELYFKLLKVVNVAEGNLKQLK